MVIQRAMPSTSMTHCFRECSLLIIFQARHWMKFYNPRAGIELVYYDLWIDNLRWWFTFRINRGWLAICPWELPLNHIEFVSCWWLYWRLLVFILEVLFFVMLSFDSRGLAVGCSIPGPMSDLIWTWCSHVDTDIEQPFELRSLAST